MNKLMTAGAASLLAAATVIPTAHAETAAGSPPVVTAVTGGPQKGANSFTEGQAQGRIADAGYTSVAGLKMDANGVWRGNAMKNGQQVGVWLDYTGSVGQS